MENNETHFEQANASMEIAKPPAKKRIWLQLLFLGVLLALTTYLLFEDESPATIWGVISKAHGGFILLGILCILLVQLCETINLNRTLKSLDIHVPMLRGYKYTLIGAFFSAITPAASGGQPLEIYYAHKDGLPVSSMTLALLVNLFGYQFATITLALCGFFTNIEFFLANPGIFFLFVLGITLNSMALGLLIIGIYSRRLSNFLVNLVIRFLRFIRLKKADQIAKKVQFVLDDYHKNSSYVKSHPSLIIKTIITSFVEFFLLFLIAYWTYRSLGFNEYNFWDLTLMQATVFGACSCIPSPGSVGVSEGAFIAIMGTIYPVAMIKSATILFRLISFYFLIILSAIVVIVNSLVVTSRDRKKAAL